MSVPYYPVLCIIRQELEQAYDNYPEWKCQHATRAVAHVLAETYALKEVAGIYVPEPSWHAWNYDPELKICVDLSMDQFPGHPTKITILAATTPLLKKDHKRTRQHKISMKEQPRRLEDVINKSKDRAQSLCTSLTH